MSKEPDEGTRPFGHFLQQVEEGAFHADLSDTLQSTCKELESRASRFEAKQKGSLTVQFDFVVNPNGTVSVRTNFKTKLPPIPRQESTFWLTKSSNLVGENPRQTKLALREVPAANVAPRDIPDEPRAARQI